MTLPDRMTDSITRILLVDDEQTMLDLLAEMLSDLGYQVTSTTDPSHALAFVSREEFHVVFLDQYLGRVKGTDLMENMAAHDNELSFIIMTGNGNTRLAVEALQRGAADFLAKPFFEQDVIRSLAFVNKKREFDKSQKNLVAELEQRIHEKTEELIQINFSVLASLARAVEKKDLGTYGHSKRVSRYADQIAERLRLQQEERTGLRTAALLHDIGKIGLDDRILGKPAPLTTAEMELVRRHPENGVEILKPLQYYHPILPAILHHHEQYDGSGYPEGLRGERIPLAARIISVADTYDAILSDRPYRLAAGQALAFEVLRSGSGKQFDPSVVQAFLHSIIEGSEAVCGYNMMTLLRDDHKNNTGRFHTSLLNERGGNE